MLMLGPCHPSRLYLGWPTWRKGLEEEDGEAVDPRPRLGTN